MSTFRVTAEQLTIHPHPNADALELAQVGEYRAVVAKNQYKTGDWALYIPEQAILPDPLIEELGLTGRLAGKEKNRVKAIRLRGELSQGIVCRPKFNFTPTDEFFKSAHENGYDFAEDIGVFKWVPPIPAHMSGKVIPAAELMRWIDIENIKRFPDVFTAGEDVVATEKIHGTACIVSLDTVDRKLLVSSKGFGSKSQALEYDEFNLYWRAVEAYRLDAMAEEMLVDWSPATHIGIYGEVFGSGVQDLAYGADASRNDTLGYRVFDIALFMNGERIWLAQDVVESECVLHGVPSAPCLYAGPYNYGVLEEVATGKSTLADHVREGVVVRPAVERRSEVLGGRAIAKFINPDYLTRKGGTEYE